MGNPGVTEAQAREALDALEKAGGVKEYAARALGLHVNTYRNRLKRASQMGLVSRRPVMDGFEITKTTAVLDEAGNITREFVQQKPERDLSGFNLPEGHAIKGVSAYLDGSGNVIGQWVKTREGGRDPLEFAAALKEAMQGTFAPMPPAPPDTDDDLLTVYLLPDLHLGMRSYSRETGENYDLSIATDIAKRGIDRLVAMSPPARHAALVFLGDYFHQNDQTNATPRSKHQLDVDGRWRLVYGVGARLAIGLSRAVAERHENVEVAVLPGNHDEDAAKTLAVAMDIQFDNEDRLSLYQSHEDHWYHRFGSCLLGATHGHRMKPDRMAMMLASDRAKDWGETRFRHLFFGHVHHESAKEVGPVRVESFSSPAAKDAYAASSGYRAGRALNAITFHAERGEVCRHRVNIFEEPNE